MRITHNNEASNPLELWNSTTLVTKNLHEHESQLTIAKKLKRIFGEENRVYIHFGHFVNHMEDRQSNWHHIQCLNVAMYIECLYKSNNILRRRVDLIPHKGGMGASEFNKIAIHLAHAPTKEAAAKVSKQ